MISNALVVPPEQDDLSFSSIHRDPDTSILHPAYSPSSSSSLDPSSFFLPPDPASTTTIDEDDDESHPDHQRFLSSSEMSSSQPWSSSASASTVISSSTSTSGRRQNAQVNSPSSNSFASSSSSSQQPYRPQFQHQGGGRYNPGPSSYRPNLQHPPYRLPSPSGPPSKGFGRPPPSSGNFPLHQQQLQPSSFNPHLHSSPSSPSGPNYAYGGGLPGVEGGGGGAAGGESEGGRAWSPFPAPGGAPPSPFPLTYGLPHQGGGIYPPGSSSSAASSPGGYQTSNSFDPRGPSPTPSSLDASPNRSSSAASSSNRYRHQPPPQQGYGNNNQNLRPPFSLYQHRSPGPPPPPPSSFYQPNLYQSPPPLSSTPGGLSHPNAMQPHTVQGPDGQTWMYFPIPVASGYYGGQPLPFQDNSAGGGGGPSFPGGMGAGPYGPYGSGTYPYGAGGMGGISSASSPHLGPLPSSPSPLNASGPSPFPTPFPLSTPSPLPLQGLPQGLGLVPSSRPIPTGPSSSSISPRSNLSHHSSSSSNLVRKPYHPPPPTARSEWVMWCGNVPSDASQDELDAFFNSQSVVPNSISSIFNISRSQCCFVNFTSQEALEAGITKFNGMPIRPDEGVRSARLVCRVRRKEDDLKAGVGGQRGRGVHTGWVREKQQQQQQVMNRERENKEVGEEVAGIAAEASATSGVGGNGSVGPATTMMRSRTHHQGSAGSVRTMSSQASTDSTFLAKNFPVRYFIMKSLTSVDLETSVQQGLWATQVHNEQTLDQAYRTSKEVILIFGANKTGEFFGYAKMASGIGKSERRISWASRESGSGSVKSPVSPTRSSFSTASHPIIHHRGSALSERIVEDVEDETGSGDDDKSPAPEHIRAASASNPSSGASKPDPPSSSSSLSLPLANQPETDELKSNGGGLYLFPEVRASPGEISPGEESKYSSLGSDLPATPSTATTISTTTSKPPTLLTKVLDRDGRGERVSAPASLERRALSSPNIPRPLQGLTLDPADLSRLRVSDASPSSPTSPLSASSNVNLQAPRLSTALGGVEDEDGVTRKDYSRSSLSSNSNSTRLSTSAGSGASRASLVLPNLHLPPSPTSVALPGEGGTRRMFGTAPGEGGEGGGAEVWGTPFKVEWVRTTRLPFHRVRHLRNPWNQDREIKVSRDGTEVEPEIGRLLLAAWDTPISPPQFPTYLTSPPPGTTYDPDQFNAHIPPPAPSPLTVPPPPPPSSLNNNNLTPPPPVLGLSMGLAPSFQQWGQYGMGR